MRVLRRVGLTLAWLGFSWRVRCVLPTSKPMSEAPPPDLVPAVVVACVLQATAGRCRFLPRAMRSIGVRLSVFAAAAGWLASIYSAVDGAVAHDTLATDGIFAVTRNPVYLAAAPLVLAFAVLVDSPWAALVGAAFAWHIATVVVPHEEAALAAKFGAAYARYAERTPRWL